MNAKVIVGTFLIVVLLAAETSASGEQVIQQTLARIKNRKKRMAPWSFNDYDQNSDDHLTVEEIKNRFFTKIQTVFNEADTNGNGFLSSAEFSNAEDSIIKRSPC